MRSYLTLGPVRLRVGSKNLASWGFPRLQIGGLSVWQWTNGGEFMPLAYHPRKSITWVWFLAIARNARFSLEQQEWRRELHRRGNPHAPTPRWWHCFLDFDGLRRSQWHDYVRLPFGFVLIIGRQHAMRRNG
jgi:hypothetical protein